MSYIAWNCQGLGNPWTVRALGEFLCTHRPELIFLMDTRLGKNGIDRLKQRFNLFGISVPSVGRSGGLALLWNKEQNVLVQSYSKNHIDASVETSSGTWRFTGFYGEPDSSKRTHTWELLKRLSQQSIRPWLVCGDFNEVVSQRDKKGGLPIPEWRLRNIRETMSYCELTEIPFHGYPFTWSNQQEEPEHIELRLDRALASTSWLQLHTNATVTHLFSRNSDHNPILIQPSPPTQSRRHTSKPPRKAKFRFESMWLRMEECAEVVSENWMSDAAFLENAAQCQLGLVDWEKRRFGSVKKEIVDIKRRLEQLQNRGNSTETRAEKRDLKARLEELLDREELMWSQRAKAQWLAEGDRNTQYFHSKTTDRVKWNEIEGLRDGENNLCTEFQEMSSIINEHFSTIFQSRRPEESAIADVLGVMRAKVGENINRELRQPFTPSEVKKALFDMFPLKSPGPDGYPALFYQRFWSVVGNSVTKCVLEFLNDRILNPQLNFTHVVLIPKCKKPDLVSQFRPISLSNVVFKMASKAITNRLKPHMPKIISETQSAFVPNRLITDNVLVAYEVNHFLKQKVRGKENFMAVKLDMSKAYDKVEWVFLKRVLECLGFEDNFISLIMLSVTSVSYSFLLNGHPLEPIQPERGIRQGDPLSPYLFLFVTEAFSALIREAAEREVLKGVSVAPGAPRISHLLFADDTLLFCSATSSAATEISDILYRYNLASGQEINLDKSTVVFSRNTPDSVVRDVTNNLPVKVVEKHDKYLGLPTTMGKSKKEIFSWLRERVWNKLQGYGHKLLSRAGKEVLIKAVIQAIPTYVMSCFKLPDSLLQEINSMIARFWWSNGQEKSIHWEAWEKLCMSKKEGGMGFRDLKSFNLALLAKQGWRLLTNPRSLLGKVFKAKYFPSSSILEAGVQGADSFTWKSIMGAMDIIREGSRWRVGDGSTINIWKDSWIPREGSFRPYTPDFNNLQDCTVSGLLDSGIWNENLVRTIFWDTDATAILQIPLPVNSVADKLIWHHTKNGHYSVRSGYHVARKIKLRREQERVGSSSNSTVQSWSWIWKLDCPNKIKVFVWRAVRNTLPTKSNLQKKGVLIDNMCPVCSDICESPLHTFRDCNYARLLWALTPIPSGFLLSDSDVLLDWFQQVRNKCDTATFVTFVTTCWSIWANRNRLSHGQQAYDAQESARYIQNLLDSYKVGKQVYASPVHTRDTQQWECPTAGVVKINFDAAWKASSGASIGVVARNERGEVLAWKRRSFNHINCPETAECVALREAAILGVEKQYSRIIFEGDSKNVILQAQELENCYAPYGSLVEEVHDLVESLQFVSFVFVRRTANTLAHLLASHMLADSEGSSQLPRDVIPVF